MKRLLFFLLVWPGLSHGQTSAKYGETIRAFKRLPDNAEFICNVGEGQVPLRIRNIADGISGQPLAQWMTLEADVGAIVNRTAQLSREQKQAFDSMTRFKVTAYGAHDGLLFGNEEKGRVHVAVSAYLVDRPTFTVAVYKVEKTPFGSRQGLTQLNNYHCHAAPENSAAADMQEQSDQQGLR